MHAVSCKHSNMMVLWLLYVVKSKTKHNVGVQSKKQKNLRGTSSFSSQNLIVLALQLMYSSIYSNQNCAATLYKFSMIENIIRICSFKLLICMGSITVTQLNYFAFFDSALSCNENDGDPMDRDSQYSSSQKTKRMRTSFKHHQLRTMKSYFAINHNPDAKDLKQLAQKTGLTKRVLQVRKLPPVRLIVLAH